MHPKHKVTWNEQNLDLAKRLYLEGKSIQAIANKFGLSSGGAIWYQLKKAGVQIRSQSRPGALNPNYNRFSRDWSEEKAKELFAIYEKSRGLADLAKRSHVSSLVARRVFRTFLPDIYDDAIERKKGHNYERGRRFEWRVRDHYRELGYFVLRSARSLGPFDLVAIKKGEVLLIQCKTGDHLGAKDRQRIIDLANSIGAKGIFVYRVGNLLKIRELKGGEEIRV